MERSRERNTLKRVIVRRNKSEREIVKICEVIVSRKRKERLLK